MPSGSRAEPSRANPSPAEPALYTLTPDRPPLLAAVMLVTFFEVLAAVVAISNLGHQRGDAINVWIDNEAARFACQAGYSTNAWAARIVSEIWVTLTENDVDAHWDRVDTKALEDALMAYGIGGTFLEAIKSTFHSEFRVLGVWGFDSSDLFPQETGIRQGCPMSPLLFVIMLS